MPKCKGLNQRTGRLKRGFKWGPKRGKKSGHRCPIRASGK